MTTIGLILLVFAFVLSVVAGCFVEKVGNWHLGWVAFAFFCAAIIFGNAATALHFAH